jgi:hypothetical protein
LLVRLKHSQIVSAFLNRIAQRLRPFRVPQVQRSGYKMAYNAGYQSQIVLRILYGPKARTSP